MRRYRKKTRERPAGRRWTSLVLATVTAIVSIFGRSTNVNAEEISVSVSNNVSADVMLAQKDTSLNLTNFEKDLKQSLKNKGINTNNINFTTASTKEVSATSDDVDFKKVVDSWTKIGMGKAFYVDSSGYLTLDLTASSPAYLGFGGTTNFTDDWTPEQNFKSCAPGWYGEGAFSNVDWKDQHIETICDSSGTLKTGIAFNVTVNEDNTLSGYFINTCYHNVFFHLYRFDNYALDDYFSHGINAAMWCHDQGYRTLTGSNQPTWVGDTKLSTTSITIHDSKGNNDKNVSGYYSPNAGINSDKQSYFYDLGAIGASKSSQTYWDVDYQSSTGKITVKVGTSKGSSDIGNVTVYDDTYTHGAFGVWGNNCEQKASTIYKSYSVSGLAETKTTYKEILTQPKWRDNAEHIVVNVDDSIDDTLTGSSNIGESLSRTLADNIHFIQWGSKTNEAASKDFINRNDNKGLFIYGNDYNKAIDDTANYIMSLIKQKSDTGYIIAGESADFTVSPANLKTNAVSSAYPDGRWLIKHDDTCFSNSEGKKADVYLKTLDYQFDKPGKYEIYFDGKKVKKIYAHRKPVSDFEINLSGTNLSLTSKAYDLDSNADLGYGKGIAKEAWYYKEASVSDWTCGKLTTFTPNKIFMIKLEVTDGQGVTASTVKYVGTGAPVASFTIRNSVINTLGRLEADNTSYDPQGNDLKYSWTLKRSGIIKATYTDKTLPDIDFSADSLGTGTYSLELKLTNSVGTESQTFSKIFTVEDAMVTNTIKHWLWGFNGEGNNSWNGNTAFNIADSTFSAAYKSTFIMNSQKSVMIPNGCYFGNTFLEKTNGSWEKGTYVGYTIDQSLTQKATQMDFQYNYYPYDYSITYNLNGGTNNSANPSTYNVLYGISLKTPTRTGYTFTGWYDENGNKVTSINEGCNATFSSTNDLYAKLATRTTGNRTLTAKWEPISWTTKYDANGGNGTMADTTHQFYCGNPIRHNQFTRPGWTMIGWTYSRVRNGVTEWMYGNTDGSWKDPEQWYELNKNPNDTKLYVEYNLDGIDNNSTYINGDVHVAHAQWQYNPVSVKVPQVLTGDHTGRSQFRVKCDDFKAGNIKITVPDSFPYKQADKADVTAAITSKSGNNIITPSNKVCVYNITTTNGLSAGCWQGSFNIGLTLTKE